MKENVYNLIRNVLLFLGGILITKGYIDESELSELIGAIMTLIGFVWSFIQNNNGKEEETDTGTGEV